MALIYDERIEADFQVHWTRDPFGPIGPLHYHHSYEIFVCLIPQMHFLINGYLYPVQYGDLLCFSDQDLHQALPSQREPYERLVIVFKPDLVWPLCSKQTNLLACFEDADTNRHKTHLNETQIDCMLSILNEYQDWRDNADVYGSDVRLKMILADLLINLNNWCDQQEKLEPSDDLDSDMEQILAYIHRHMSEPLTLEHLAWLFHRSLNRLNDRFKAYTGQSVHQYIVQSRVALAKRCLMTGLSVTETSLACGYTSLSHFCRLFKKQTGLTPGDYASQVKKDR